MPHSLHVWSATRCSWFGEINKGFASVSKHTKKTFRIFSSRNFVWKSSDRWNPNKIGQCLPCSETSRNCGEAQKYHSLEKLIKLHFRTPYQNGCEQLLLMNLYSGITLWRWKKGADHKATKNSLTFCQTLQLTLSLHPKNTNKPEVPPGLPIWSMQE